MPTPGYVFRDGGTTPPPEAESTTPKLGKVTTPTKVKEPEPVRQSPLQEKTSESHALAVDEPEIKGAVHEAGKEARITNLGWQANAEGVETLVGGLPNEELWTLVRRFNKVRVFVCV